MADTGSSEVGSSEVGSSEERSSEARSSDETLPRSLRVRRARDYTRIQRQGARGSAGCLQIVVRRTAPGRGRFGLTVSKKVGNAVARNLVKRRLREIFRKNKGLFTDLEVVIIARPGAAEVDFRQLADDALLVLRRATEAVTRPKRPGHRR